MVDSGIDGIGADVLSLGGSTCFLMVNNDI